MIRRYYGFLGSGNSTYAVKLAVIRARLISLGLDKKHRFVYTNLPIEHPFIRHLDYDMFDFCDFSNCLLIIDEATFFSYNRDFKSFDEHYNCDIYLFDHEFVLIDNKIRIFFARIARSLLNSWRFFYDTSVFWLAGLR